MGLFGGIGKGLAGAMKSAIPGGGAKKGSFLSAAMSIVGRRKPRKERFSVSGRQEIKDLRLGGGRKMFGNQKTRMGATSEDAAAMAGGRLPGRMWKKAAKGGYSVPWGG